VNILTNADKIRNMSDEELADLFTRKTPFIDGKYSSRHGEYYSSVRNECLKDELEWLQSNIEF
jgi:hypothetical protein